jgi:ribonuclease BN (tRNA processing enzyme)
MQIEVLGASGGLGSNQTTTSLRVGRTTLIDAGSGVGRLSTTEISCIDKVFLTHTHMDHIAYLPLLIDALFEQLLNEEATLEIYALPDIIGVLERHIFNGQIWPDFSALPGRENPVLQFVPLTPWEGIRVDDEGTEVMPFRVNHQVEACGYLVTSPEGKRFVFSGDTDLDDDLVETLQRLSPIDTLMLECAFPDRHAALARSAGHLTPALVRELLDRLPQPPQTLWISHIKPNYRSEIEEELKELLKGRQWKCL